MKDLDCFLQKAYAILNEGGKFVFNVASSIEKHFRVSEMYSEEFSKHMLEIFLQR